MNKRNSYLTLIIWIAVLLLIGSLLGSLTKAEVNTWYASLNRSPLTPPNYAFGIAWTILYAMIAICGWMIWRIQSLPKLTLIKNLYIIQLILNWSWTPLFFSFHLIGMALLSLVLMNVMVSMIIGLSLKNMKNVAYLMIPYQLWILFAGYLNFYIWLHN